MLEPVLELIRRGGSIPLLRHLELFRTLRDAHWTCLKDSVVTQLLRFCARA